MVRPSERPLGIFDSGVGGLTIVQEVRRLLPQEDILYYADSQHCPYGGQPPLVITAYAEEATRFLLARGAKAIVVACNTASSAALRTLRQEFPIPIVGMVPAVKPATAATRTHRVGVLATPATVHGALFAELLTEFAGNVAVFTETCPGLVELLEEGQIPSPQVASLLRRFLAPLLAQEVDILVLGCTHFPLLRSQVEEIVGPGVEVIDSGAAVARQVGRVLEQQGLRATRARKGWVRWFTSGDAHRFASTLEALLRQGALDPRLFAPSTYATLGQGVSHELRRKASSGHRGTPEPSLRGPRSRSSPDAHP